MKIRKTLVRPGVFPCARDFGRISAAKAQSLKDQGIMEDVGKINGSHVVPRISGRTRGGRNIGSMSLEIYQAPMLMLFKMETVAP